MRMVVAYIRREAFGPVRGELEGLGLSSMSIAAVDCWGRGTDVTVRYRGATLTNHLCSLVKLECVVAAADVPTVLDAVLKHAPLDSVGDHRVFVLPMEAHPIPMVAPRDQIVARERLAAAGG